MAPRILPRPEHNVSRKNIDPDAVKVLYRLKSAGFKAYLVGGGVRDLLLNRRPKDFDIGTDAHPAQVRRLFRNCFVVGRRFRLCHVRFGRKVVEVSTFRSQAPADDGDPMIRRDNTFGTPEQDAFRRDFTINALFYDIASFSVIDYVGGLEDLRHGVIRAIGDPAVRFREDPVRMLRAVAIAARLGFSIDTDTVEAIRFLRGEIVKSSPSRLIDEFYKILRQGASRRTFEMLHELGLLAYLLPAADRVLTEGGEQLLGSLGRLDGFRNAGLATIEELTNPLLMGTLVVPLGIPLKRAALRASNRRPLAPTDPEEMPPPPPPVADDVAAEIAALGVDEEDAAAPLSDPEPLALPFARRDLDRLRLILLAQHKLREIHRSPRVKHLIASKAYFEEALRWMEIHAGVEGHELAAYWRSLDTRDLEPPAILVAPPPEPTVADSTEDRGLRRRRRRRRRRAVRPPAIERQP